MLKELTALALVALLAGCVGGTKRDLTPAEEARFNSLPNETIVNETKSSLSKALDEKLDVFAPKHFAAANEATRQAAKELADKDRDGVIANAARAERELAGAYKAKGVALSVLADPLRLDMELTQAEAPTLHAKEYAGLKEKMRMVIAGVEGDDLKGAQKLSSDLAHEMEALLVRIVKENALAEAQKLMDQINKENVGELAPKSLETATAALLKAEATIQRERNNEAAVAEAAAYALQMIREARYIAKRVEELRKVEPKYMEQVIQAEENRLAEVAAAAGLKNMAGMSLRERVYALVDQAKTLADAAAAADSAAAKSKAFETDLAEARAALAASEQKLQPLRAENDRLKQQAMLAEERLKAREDVIEALKFGVRGGAPAQVSASVRRPAAVEPPPLPQAVEAPAAVVEPTPAPQAVEAPAAAVEPTPALQAVEAPVAPAQ
jgi:hypothetical protein